MPRNLHAIPQAVQQADEREAQFGFFVVGEFVGEEVDGAAGGRLGLKSHEPPHAVSAQRRDLPVRGEPDHALDQRGGRLPRSKKVIEWTHRGAKGFHGSHPRHHPRAQRRPVAVILLLKNLAAEARHIDIGRALGEAALAGQAGVKYLCHSRIVEAAAARQRFAQDVRAGAGGAQFIGRFLVRRAHRPADQVGLQAGAGTVALLDRAQERIGLGTDAAGTIDLALVEDRAPVVPGPDALHGISLPYFEPQAFVHRRRVHNLVPVEHALRVPAALDFLHHGIYFGPIHKRDEFPAEAAVAMLAAQTPLVLPHQERRFARDVPEQPPPLRRLDVQDRP